MLGDPDPVLGQLGGVFGASQGIEKGIEYLYHANSVATACQLIRSKALLSRGTVMRKGLAQTTQYSDGIDREHGVRFDVFTDFVDIHSRAGRRNKYGPVLFVIDIRVLLEGDTGPVWVTKSNPTKWGSLPSSSRWFNSAQELNDQFIFGEFDQMLVFRHSGGQLNFLDHLHHIVIDDPSITNSEGINYLSLGMGALRLALQDGNAEIPIKKRECPSSCKCLYEYTNLENFDPNGGVLKFYDGKI